MIAHELAGVEVIETNCHAVGANGGPVCWCSLLDRERSDGAICIGGQCGAERVHSGGFKPQLGPGGQVATGSGFQFNQEVLELCVAIGVLLEVLANTSEELLLAYPGTELLEYGTTLGIGDAIEVHAHCIEVRNIGHDRVGGRKLVLAVCPTLLHHGEGGPGFMPFGGFCGGQGGGVFSEAFVQPQVIPPAHGDQVAKPHVSKLMQDGDHATLTDGVGDFGAEDVCLGEGDAARVLHCTCVELRDKELVVLVEGVGVVELRFEVFEALTSLFKDVVSIHVFRQ